MNPVDADPYDDKTIAEVVHDYAVVRGDLCEQYARDQLVRIIEKRILAARAVPAHNNLADKVRALADELYANGCNHRHQQGDTDECNSCTAFRFEELLGEGAATEGDA